jgi:hypothetical protein
MRRIDMASVRRRPAPLAALAAVVLIAAAYAHTSVGLSAPSGVRATLSRTHVLRSTTALPAAVPPALQVTPRRSGSSWAVVAQVHGQPAALVSQRGGVTTARFDQHLVHLNLHAGSLDGGTSGWTYGNRVTALEANKLVAAFNGGFKLTYTNVGFMSGGHVAVPLKAGLASIVTYTDGTTDIGAWHASVPGAGKTVFSVLQNQRLLVDHGVAAANVSSCVINCWGGTIGLAKNVARSGLGITANGQLVWAAGESLSPSELASALIRAGAVRAIELDINPAWVAGYLYAHHPRGLAPAPMAPGQRGIEGKFLTPYSRDFLTVVAN